MSSGSGDWVKDLSVQFKCGDGWHQERLSDDTVEYIKAKLQEVDKAAREDELSLACHHWEDNPNTPATYMIDRLAELRRDSNATSLKGGDV